MNKSNRKATYVDFNQPEYHSMTKEDLLKIREKLHKRYISLLMSSEYNLPTSTRSQAEIKWIDVYVAFNSAFDLHEEEEND